MIQYENQKEYFVIVVKRGNEEKFVAKNYYSKQHINCSIKPDKAMKFQKEKYAYEFWDKWNGFDEELSFVGLKKIIISYRVNKV